ncbi:nuclear poly(A) polymerase 3-like isoform X2 [Solanum dulcamara]|uniref:nuclear poly(A) polymerase 3-like isoform X2 n=1 Tax=Solanum dulcamara TaxID=45834 RepID=UPI002484EA40|nr:nuclear poly(A) polymerase 3-like isoform X2 [Solanum dulcamara]
MEFVHLENQQLVDPRHVNTYLPRRSIGLCPNSNLDPQVRHLPPPDGVLGFRGNPDVILRMEMERSMSLFQIMGDEGLVPSQEEEMKRRNAIDKLKKIVREWVQTVAYHHGLPKRYLRFASGTILTYGSYGLGVHNSESDIDALCVGPCFATIEEDFFIVLHKILASRPEVSDIHCVKGAKVPLMRFKFDGISIDLPYARLKVISIPEDVDVFNPFFLKNIDDTSRKSLSGVRANRRILQLVPNVEIFQAVLRCIKLWAKRRGVYGNLLGFFGGVHLAVLSAFICKRHPTASLSALFFIFFKTFAFWPWPTPVVLQDGVAWPFIPMDKVLWMPIQLPCSPYQLCHSNIVRSTFLKIKNEFMRGYMLTKLEELLGFCDPNPTEYVDVDASDPNAVFYWGLPPARTDMINIGHVEEEFLNSTKNVYQGPTGKMKLSIVQADQLPQKAHFGSKRQSAKPCWRIVRSNQRKVPAYYKYQPIRVDRYLTTNACPEYQSAGG